MEDSLIVLAKWVVSSLGLERVAFGSLCPTQTGSFLAHGQTRLTMVLVGGAVAVAVAVAALMRLLLLLHVVHVNGLLVARLVAKELSPAGPVWRPAVAVEAVARFLDVELAVDAVGGDGGGAGAEEDARDHIGHDLFAHRLDRLGQAQVFCCCGGQETNLVGNCSADITIVGYIGWSLS